MRALSIFILLTIFAFQGFTQTGVITGKVVDRTNKGFPEIIILLESDRSFRTKTNLDGYFELSVPVGLQTIIIQFDDEVQKRNIEVLDGKIQSIDKVKLNVQYFSGVDVTAKGKDHSIDDLPMIEIGRIPTPTASVESYLTFTTAATSNNELTNNYNVRGGSYDEHLVYVNGFEIYRPFLTRSGQQEGMSFINPNLVESIAFSAGGFAANYGDRLSRSEEHTSELQSR